MDSALATTPVRRHPLGFLIARIDGADGTALRLHFWSKAWNAPQIGFEVHDHAFDFESFVVGGQVRQTIYEMLTAPTGDCRVYSVGYERGRSTLVASDRVTYLEAVSSESYVGGQAYSLPAKVLHRLECVSAEAVTLVLTKDRGLEPVTVGPLNGPDELLTERPIVLDPTGAALTLAGSTQLKDMMLSEPIMAGFNVTH